MIQRHDSIIVQKTTQILIPLIFLFAAYVYFHGHYSPGGGFQGGVLIGAAIILQLLVGTQKELKKFSIHREFVLAGMGVAVFAIAGGLALLYGGLLFDYGTISIYGSEIPMRRYLGILLTEGGVVITVSMTLVVIFHVLAFLPNIQKEKS